MRDESTIIEGRNAVLEALRADKSFDRIFLLSQNKDGPLQTIYREAQKRKIQVNFVKKERLDELSSDRKHQGVVAYVSAFEYATVDDILANAEKKNEPPFIIILDDIEDPHNLGAVIRTANAAGAHGVIIPKNNAAGLTTSAVKASAGAVSYTPVARVTNISRTMEELKEQGIWFIGADMNGEDYRKLDLKGPIGLVIGNEGKGLSPLVKKNCDFLASLPMKGEIDSLNASVAAGIMAYEIMRSRG